MPIKNLLCKKREMEVSFDECIDCSKTNSKCDMFPELIQFLKDDAEETNPDLTITKLLYCPRRAYLLAKTYSLYNQRRCIPLYEARWDI